jgi:hypothetical protein
MTCSCWRNTDVHSNDSWSGFTEPPIRWLQGAHYLWVKLPGREADHSLPSSVEVKECVELYLHSPIRLHGVVLSLKKSQELYFYHFNMILPSIHRSRKCSIPCRDFPTKISPPCVTLYSWTASSGVWFFHTVLTNCHNCSVYRRRECWNYEIN